MAIFSTTNYSEAQRRNNIRELSDTSVNAFDDAKIDPKIENADSLTEAMWPGNAVPSDAHGQRMFIITSNINAAILIRVGIGGEENDVAIRNLQKMCKDIIASVSDRTPEQNEQSAELYGSPEGTFL